MDVCTDHKTWDLPAAIMGNPSVSTSVTVPEISFGPHEIDTGNNAANSHTGIALGDMYATIQNIRAGALARCATSADAVQRGFGYRTTQTVGTAMNARNGGARDGVPVQRAAVDYQWGFGAVPYKDPTTIAALHYAGPRHQSVTAALHVTPHIISLSLSLSLVCLIVSYPAVSCRFGCTHSDSRGGH
jgi:hypothetical protein